jgi:hypothetical protein
VYKTRTVSPFFDISLAPFKAAIYLAYPGYSTLAKLEKYQRKSYIFFRKTYAEG